MVALASSAAHILHHLHFPNESQDYRRARNALLDEEMELRATFGPSTGRVVRPSGPSGFPSPDLA